MAVARCVGVVAALGLLTGAFAACGDSGGGGTSSGACPVAVGDLVITEVFANPAGDDSGKEWFEVYNATNRALDLTGVRILSKGSGEKLVVIDAGVGVVLQPGTYGVFASGPQSFGQLYVYTDALGTLRNSGGTLQLICGDGSVVDGACWGDACDPAQAAPGDDQSWALASNGAPNYQVNDDPTQWTLDAATPGVANRPPGGPDTCICRDAAGDFTQRRSPSPGELMITEVLADVPGTEAEGKLLEWFEVTLLPTVDGNRAMACLGTKKSNETNARALDNPDEECLEFAPGSKIVFGRSSDGALNGGLTVDAVYAGPDLTKDGTLELVRGDGTLIDAVAYGSSNDGVARQLDQNVIDNGDVLANDVAEAWCHATPVYNATLGARGTPGADNFLCDACYCQDAGAAWRIANSPAIGELVITEVFGNTPSTEDSDFEWIEVAFIGSEARDLNCLQPVFGEDVEDTLGSVEGSCTTANPGDIVVLCADPVAAAEVSIASCVGYDGRALKNTDTVAFRVGDTDIATASYDGLSDGVAWQNAGVAAAGGACDYALSDADLVWCDAADTDIYATRPKPGDETKTLTYIGTPGVKNPCCPAGTP